MDDEAPADVLRSRLRRDLGDAMKARQRDSVAALRNLMAAIDNAEATGVHGGSANNSPGVHIAGATTGVGSSEAERRRISATELSQILDTEITDLEEQADVYDSAGRTEDAAILRFQASVISLYRAPT